MKIGYKLSLGFIAVLIPLSLIYYGIMLYIQHTDVETHAADEINHMEQVFHNLQERDTKILSSTLEVVVNLPSFKKLYLEGDREKLFNYGQPLFQKLKANYGITHFYFIQPDGHCFVRLHDKNIYGDLITRFTFWGARDTKVITSGIELGKTAFALRAVSPYYLEGELIGYVELGEEIEHFLEILKSETGNEFAIIADKEHLDREKWRSVRNVAGLRDNWDDLETHLVLAATSTHHTASECFTEESLERVKEGEKVLQRIENNDVHFICGGVEITDAGGHHSGALLALIDISDRVAIANQTNYAAMGLVAILLVIASGIGLYFSRSISGPVMKFRQAAAEISQGNLDKEVRISTKDELGQLAESFNNMTRKLRASRTGLQKQVEEREKAEKFLNSILEGVGEGIIVIDQDYRVVLTNKAYCRQAGLPCEEVVGKNCFTVSHGTVRPCYEEGEDCPVKQTFETGEPAISLHVHQGEKGRQVYVEVRSYPLKDTAGNVISAIEVITDVTEKLKLEEQLRQSQKMEAIGTLTGGIAHDFNNLLTTILGYGEFLLEEMDKDDPLRAHVEMIRVSGERAASLTQSLLAFSRKQIINLDGIELNALITKAEQLLSRLIGEDIEVKLDLADEPLYVMADSVQLEQILMNLATNARDAMPSGGRFIVATRAVEMDADFIEAHGFGVSGMFAELEVSDTGSGMDEKTREQIFEPFFTTKDVGKGTGLGLSVVYGIIKQHNGFITAYSEPGKGTAFQIYLPLARARTRDEVPQEATTQIEGGTETVLLAEDDDNVRMLIGEMLRKAGYTVLEAANGEEALEVFSEHKDSIDLLFFDIIMPRKNGIEAYREIERMRPGVRSVFISGYPLDVARKYGLHKDARLVSKPISPTEIAKKVREALDSKA